MWHETVVEVEEIERDSETKGLMLNQQEEDERRELAFQDRDNLNRAAG
jgi:hypothetical protein